VTFYVNFGLDGPRMKMFACTPCLLLAASGQAEVLSAVNSTFLQYRPLRLTERVRSQGMWPRLLLVVPTLGHFPACNYALNLSLDLIVPWSLRASCILHAPSVTQRCMQRHANRTSIGISTTVHAMHEVIDCIDPRPSILACLSPAFQGYTTV